MNHLAQDNQQLVSQFAEQERLSRVARAFVDEMPERIEDLVRLSFSDDQEEFCQAVDQIKGAAGNYGYQEIAPAATTLEQLIRKNSSQEEIKDALNEVIAICSRIRAGVPKQPTF